jgi:hypothetical protein
MLFYYYFFDRINRIFRIFIPGFPDESLAIPIAFGDKHTFLGLGYMA